MKTRNNPRPNSDYEIQAWECTGPDFNGYVYSQEIALSKFADGCDITMVWLPRSRQPGYGTWRVKFGPPTGRPRQNNQ